jgi:hypothetical protein
MQILGTKIILEPPMVDRPLSENAVQDLLTRMRSKIFFLASTKSNSHSEDNTDLVHESM